MLLRTASLTGMRPDLGCRRSHGHATLHSKRGFVSNAPLDSLGAGRTRTGWCCHAAAFRLPAPAQRPAPMQHGCQHENQAALPRSPAAPTLAVFLPARACQQHVTDQLICTSTVALLQTDAVGDWCDRTRCPACPVVMDVMADQASRMFAGDFSQTQCQQEYSTWPPSSKHHRSQVW